MAERYAIRCIIRTYVIVSPLKKKRNSLTVLCKNSFSTNLQLRGKCHKSVLDIPVILGRRFHHEHNLRYVLAHGLCLGKLNLPYGVQVALVPDDEYHHIGSGVAAHLVDPSLQVQEGGPLCYVVHWNWLEGSVSMR